LKHNLKHLSLDNIAGGEVAERYAQAMEDVMENILDPNTTDGKRSITITITLEPKKKDKNLISVIGDVKAKVAPRMGATTQLIIGKEDSGEVVANEIYKGQVKGQMSLEDVIEGKKTDGVLIPIESAK
jgi:hypothetical protein